MYSSDGSTSTEHMLHVSDWGKGQGIKAKVSSQHKHCLGNVENKAPFYCLYCLSNMSATNQNPFRYCQRCTARHRIDIFETECIAEIYVTYFWATAYKTVGPMLSDRCLFVLYVCLVLSVTLVYCGQIVGWIKMKLGTQVGLVPGNIVLDGDPPPPPQRGTALPQFFVHICCSQMAGWIKIHLVWR